MGVWSSKTVEWMANNKLVAALLKRNLQFIALMEDASAKAPHLGRTRTRAHHHIQNVLNYYDAARFYESGEQLEYALQVERSPDLSKGRNKKIFQPDAYLDTNVTVYFGLSAGEHAAYVATTRALEAANHNVLAIRERVSTPKLGNVILSEYSAGVPGHELLQRHPYDVLHRCILTHCIEDAGLLHRLSQTDPGMRSSCRQELYDLTDKLLVSLPGLEQEGIQAVRHLVALDVAAASHDSVAHLDRSVENVLITANLPDEAALATIKHAAAEVLAYIRGKKKHLNDLQRQTQYPTEQEAVNAFLQDPSLLASNAVTFDFETMYRRTSHGVNIADILHKTPLPLSAQDRMSIREHYWRTMCMPGNPRVTASEFLRGIRLGAVYAGTYDGIFCRVADDGEELFDARIHPSKEGITEFLNVNSHRVKCLSR
jgi:hypothetical protein